ncbi:MAG: hypothetical protein ABI045_04690 [Flavobacteriales bacterium]
MEDPISLFPLDYYDQSIDRWIKHIDPGYDKPLLSPEMNKRRLYMFYDHYLVSCFLWNPNYVKEVLQQSPPNDLKTEEQGLIDHFTNRPGRLVGYGVNFSLYI